MKGIMINPWAVDSETNAMMNIAGRLTSDQLCVWPQVRNIIINRVQMFHAGRMQAPKWINDELARLDPLLKLRWDFFEQCWIVDRFTAVERCWTPVCTWKDENGAKRLDYDLIETLRDGDMWRFPSYKEYLAYKREKTRRRREQIEKQSVEKLSAAFDSLSSDRLQNFMEVERAMKTGEKIIFGTEDHAKFSRMSEAAKRAQAQQQ